MRNIVIPILILLLLIGGCIFETLSLGNNVRQCAERLDAILVKVEEETARPEDTDQFADYWTACKSRLHTYIPHTEIRDIDTWIAEARSYLVTGNYDLARAKICIARDKILSIPDSFRTTFGNIF